MNSRYWVLAFAVWSALLAAQGQDQLQTLARFPPALAFDKIVILPHGRAIACLRKEVMLWNAESKPPALQLWAIPNGELLWTAREPVARLIAFSADSTLLLGVTTGFKVVCWDTANGRVKYVVSQTNGVGLAAFLPDGDTVLTSTGNRPNGIPPISTAGAVELRQVKTGRIIRSLSGQTNAIGGALAISRSGKTLAVANMVNGLARTVNLLAVPSGGLLRTLDFGTNVWRIDSLAFSPDGRTLASGGRQHAGGTGEVRFWDVESGGLQEILTEATPGFSGALGLKLGEGPVDVVVAFSPSGSRVAILGVNQCLCVWDTTKRKLVYALGPDDPPDNSPCAIQFVKEGVLLARVKIGEQIQLDLLRLKH